MTTTNRLQVSDTLSLPLDAVTSTFALLSVRGAGKSNAGAAMAEEMFKAGLPFVAIDPVGSWTGLRSGRDGGPAGGLPIPIFGGRRGDVPLERGAGDIIADLIVDKRLSCVLDLTNFGSESDKKAFLLAFAQRLYKKNESPLHLFLEEADDYIPQKPMRDEAQLLRAWENIVRRGRSRGLGMTLITQRSAAINKMVLTQVETLFVLRTTGPQDIKAIEAWVKYHQVDEELLGSLASLDDGEAWVWSPHYLKKVERLRFRLRETYDSGATPKNLRSKDAKKVTTLADVDLTALRERMAETIEKAKADDPRALRKRIAELEARKPERAPAPEIVNVPVITDEQFVRLDHAAHALEEHATELKEAFADIARCVQKAFASSSTRKPMTPAQEALLLRSTAPADLGAWPVRRAKTRSGNTSAPVDADELTIGERVVLTSVAQTSGGATRQQITILSGYTRSTCNTYLQRLGASERVRKDGDIFRVTARGLQALGPSFEPLPTGRDLRKYWLKTLPSGESAVFAAVVAAYPAGLTREEITAATDYTRSTCNTYLQKLGTRKLVQIVNGSARAAEELF